MGACSAEGRPGHQQKLHDAGIQAFRHLGSSHNYYIAPGRPSRRHPPSPSRAGRAGAGVGLPAVYLTLSFIPFLAASCTDWVQNVPATMARNTSGFLDQRGHLVGGRRGLGVDQVGHVLDLVLDRRRVEPRLEPGVRDPAAVVVEDQARHRDPVGKLAGVALDELAPQPTFRGVGQAEAGGPRVVHRVAPGWMAGLVDRTGGAGGAPNGCALTVGRQDWPHV